MMRDHNDRPQPTSVPEPTGIVSVNSRGGANNGMTGKIAFGLLVVGLVIIGGLIAFNKYSAAKKADETASQLAAGVDNKPAELGKRRIFNTDPPPLPNAVVGKGSPAAASTGLCPDLSSGQPLLGPDGKPMAAPSGQPIRVCGNGQVIVPAIQLLPGEAGQPIPVIPTGGTRSQSSSGPAPVSRYGGDVMLPTNGRSTNKPSIDPNNPYMQALLGSTTNSPVLAGPRLGLPATSTGNGDNPHDTRKPHGSISNLLNGTEAKAVTATLIGDRDMILPEGRSIDCNLSVRLINEVSGKATCVLSSNVYSDNGRVVLAERGSTAVGEYVAITAQGQRRLFVLWTRLQTPKGIVINVNSPAADAMGTSGLPGHVDNRWSERIGAAVLLSLVEDAIGYATAKAATSNGNGGAQGIAVFESTTQTGHSLAERILDSTINIKPTIYKNQGDRATIFVSRDLDFGSVYALRAK